MKWGIRFLVLINNMKKIKVLLVGVRGFGQKIADAIMKAESLELSACFHNDESVAKECGGLYNCKYFTNFEEAINSPEIEAVALVTPNHLHYSQIKACIRAGKHIFVEKPITNKLNEAEEVVAEIEGKILTLMVGHNMRRNDAIRKMKKLIDEGKIGEIVSGEINMSHAGGMKLTSDKWRYWRDKCPGGSLMMLGTHSAEISNYLFGHAKNVKGVLKKLYAPSDAEDTSAMLLDLENGGYCYIANNYNHPGTHFVRAYGTKGILEFNRNLGLLTFQGIDIDKKPAELINIPFEKNDMLLEEMEEWGKCIQEREKPETSGREAIEALKIVTAIL